jgi:hypothetical protein
LLALVPAAERAALPRQADGLPPERMLRELAQRQERAQRLSLGTYRVAEAAQKGRRVKELKQALLST